MSGAWQRTVTISTSADSPRQRRLVLLGDPRGCRPRQEHRMFEDATRRLRALIFTRVLLVTLLLGSFYILQIEYVTFLSPTAFSYLIAGLYFLTIVYAVTLRWIKTTFLFAVFAYVQIFIDVIAETFLIYLTGGIESWFPFIFLLSIISASIVLNRRASYYAASLSSILYGVIINLQLYNLLPGLTGSIFAAKDYLYNIFAHILSFYLVAFLSGYLSERLHDVTQTLYKRDSDLDNLRALSRDIVESMPSGVFTSDLNGGIITFNDSAQRITGRTSTEVIGKTPENIFPFLKDVNIRESRKRTEGEIQSKGRIIHIGIRFSTLKNSAGAPTGIIGIFQDLTEFKAMEAEIEKKKKWAFIGELSALIAHELRTPLASLKSSVEMLRERKVSGQQADHLMDIAISEMDRLNGIVTDFLLYAKPRQLVKSSFDLHQSLGNVITLLRSSKTEKENVKISKDLKGKLFITGDSKQLQQVFWNLGVNAVEAVSGSGEVVISTEKKNNTLEIRFTDTGIGIGRENIDKIFYPFFTTKDKGTGLGLAIAQRITEEHRGKITVESRGAGTGTTFKVILPVDNVRQEDSH